MTSELSIDKQTRFWNDWNSDRRKQSFDDIQTRQSEVVLAWLRRLGRKDLDVLEVGCGSGWFCPRLAEFGRVTGTDLSDEVLARERARAPEISFLVGDFMRLDFGDGTFDIVVTLDVLSCVEDQPAFVAKLAKHLRPCGHLMLATPNRPVLERMNRVPPPGLGQVRHWTDRHELARLLEDEFDLLELSSVTLRANRGIMRILNSRTFNRPVRAVVGNRLDRLKEAAGLGWTLMALARKRA